MLLLQIRPALVLLVLFTALTGIIYPLAITGIAAVVFPNQARGSLVEREGTVVGSSLIGQSFTSPRYFHSRPSATTAPDPQDGTKTVDAAYNAANSSGSNLGPLSKKLVGRVKTDIEEHRQAGAAEPLPAELGNHIGVRARPAHLTGQRPGAGRFRCRRPRPARK